MMSRFKVPQASKPRVDPAALEKFANGADADPVLPKDAVAPVEATPSASVAPEAVTARSAPVKAVRAGPPSVAPIRAAGEFGPRSSWPREVRCSPMAWPASLRSPRPAACIARQSWLDVNRGRFPSSSGSTPCSVISRPVCRVASMPSTSKNMRRATWLPSATALIGVSTCVRFTSVFWSPRQVRHLGRCA